MNIARRNRARLSAQAARREYEAPSAESFTRNVLGIRLLRTGRSSADVTLCCAIVATNARMLKQTIVDAVHDGVLHVGLDLRSCQRGDRNGFGVLLSIANGLKRRGGSLVITAISSDLAEQFRRLQLDQRFEMRTPIVEPFHAPEAFHA